MSGCNDTICLLNERVNAIQNILYHQSFLIKPIGFVVDVPAYKHCLTQIRGYLCLTPAGKDMRIGFDVFSDLSVRFTSNIALDNYFLLLY